MSAADFLRLCKYKNYLANDVHCELFFFDGTMFFQNRQMNKPKLLILSKPLERKAVLL